VKSLKYQYEQGKVQPDFNVKVIKDKSSHKIEAVVHHEIKQANWAQYRWNLLWLKICFDFRV